MDAINRVGPVIIPLTNDFSARLPRLGDEAQQRRHRGWMAIPMLDRDLGDEPSERGSARWATYFRPQQSARTNKAAQIGSIPQPGSLSCSVRIKRRTLGEHGRIVAGGPVRTDRTAAAGWRCARLLSGRRLPGP